MGTDRVNLTVGLSGERSDGLLPFNSEYLRDVASAGLRANPTASTRIDVSLRAANDEFHFATDGAGNVEDRNAFRDNQRFIGSAAIARRFSSRVNGEVTLTAMNTQGEDDDQPDSPADTIGFYYYDALTNVRRRGVDALINVLVSTKRLRTCRC